MPDSSRRKDGVRWGVIRADLENFFTRLPTMLRSDPTAVMLIVANLYPVKLTLDVLGHFVDHGMLQLNEDPEKPLWRPER
jgi:hypothetical protein